MKFTIRPWTLNDLNSLVNYANNWNIARNMTDKFPFPYTDFDGREFIEWAGQDDLIHIFAIDIEGEASGGIGIHPQDDRKMRSWAIGWQNLSGERVSCQSVSQMIAFAFDTYVISTGFARPFATNKASQRVLKDRIYS
jgi:RimJ/RimL family protein N-acetyltransferase